MASVMAVSVPEVTAWKAIKQVTANKNFNMIGGGGVASCLFQLPVFVRFYVV